MSSQSNQSSHSQNLDYHKKVSNAGPNFVPDEFKQFCRQLNIDQATTSLYMWTMDAWVDCRGQQHRQQWAVIQSEGDKNRQTNNMPNKASPEEQIMTMQYLREQTAKGTGHLEGIFMDKHSVEQNRIFNPYM